MVNLFQRLAILQPRKQLYGNPKLCCERCPDLGTRGRLGVMVMMMLLCRNAIMAFELDWHALKECDVLRLQLKPWLEKKLTEYFGSDIKADQVGMYVHAVRSDGTSYVKLNS